MLEDFLLYAIRQYYLLLSFTTETPSNSVIFRVAFFNHEIVFFGSYIFVHVCVYMPKSDNDKYIDYYIDMYPIVEII